MHLVKYIALVPITLFLAWGTTICPAYADTPAALSSPPTSTAPTAAQTTMNKVRAAAQTTHQQAQDILTQQTELSHAIQAKNMLLTNQQVNNINTLLSNANAYHQSAQQALNAGDSYQPSTDYRLRKNYYDSSLHYFKQEIQQRQQIIQVYQQLLKPASGQPSPAS